MGWGKRKLTSTKFNKENSTRMGQAIQGQQASKKRGVQIVIVRSRGQMTWRDTERGPVIRNKKVQGK